MRRRSRRSERTLVSLLLACLLPSFFRVSMANVFFFTNTNDIRKLLDDDNSKILYQDSDEPQALDFNWCRGVQKVYWISLLDGTINRGDPDGEERRDKEIVISDDVAFPQGIAVDYIGNNIYFSQQTAIRNVGKIEVVTCDGEHRRILVTGLGEAGPITLDISNGHLYYADGVSIHRVHTNGQNQERIASVSTAITGLAVDSSLNRLYWSANGTIQFIDLSETLPYEHHPVSHGLGSNPYGLAAGEGVLYWTVLGNNLTSVPGAIYKLLVAGSNDPEVLHERMDIHPKDVSTSSALVLPDDGCAMENGGCDQFCFTVPSSVAGVTTHECACSTGIKLDPVTNNCPRVPKQFLLYGRKIDETISRIAMVSLDTDLGTSVLLPFQISGLGAHFVAYDIRTHMVYWDEVDPPVIKRAMVDSSDEPEVFIGTDIRCVSGLAIDPFSRNLYWSDCALDRIEIASISSSTPSDFDGRRVRKVLVSGDVHYPQSLALDLRNGFVYWVDLDSEKPRMERAKLDGSYREHLHSSLSLLPTYLAIDPATGTVYWTDSDGDLNSIHTLNNGLDGYNINANNVHGLAVVGDGIYWSDGFGGTIGMATIDGEVVYRGNRNYIDRIPGVQGLVAVNTTAHIDENTCAINHPTFGCSHMCIYINTTELCECPDGLQFREGSTKRCIEPSGYSVVSLSEEGQWFLEIYLREVNIDEKWVLKYQAESVEIVSMAIHVLDITTADVYYINGQDKLIYRRSISNVNSNATTTIVFGEATPIITCCLATPQDLAVDWLGRNLYWTDSERGVIEVSLLNGTSRRVLYSDLDGPSLIALDPRRGFIFFTQADSTHIYYHKMDGSSPATSVLCNHDNCSITPYPITDGFVSLSIDFDRNVRFQDYLVWSYLSETRTVAVGYDLSDPTLAPVLIDPVEDDTAHTLYFNESLYYSEDGHGISRSFGVGRTDNVLMLGMVEFNEFSVAHPLSQPGYHECTAEELCTGHFPLCLIRDHIYGTCHCSLDSFKSTATGSQLQLPQDFCAKARSFIIWATRRDIYFYPLPSDLTNKEMTSEPAILPRGNHGDVVGVTYDPMTESIVWLEDGTRLLHSVSVSGQESHTLGRFPDHLSLDSMSLDWIGGQLFFTEMSGFQVEVAGMRTRGDGNVTVGSVASSYLVEDGVVSPRRPRGVLFDEENSALIWHEEGTRIIGQLLQTSQTTPTILLDESSGRSIDEPSRRSIAYLTFDPSNDYLYWWNEKAESIEGIRRSFAMDTADEDDVVTFVGGVSSIGGLSANSMATPYQSNLIFWFDDAENTLFYCNATRKLVERAEFDCRQEQLSWSPSNGDEILTMMSFDVMRFSAISTSYKCRSGEMECDYLCVEERGRAECKCPLFRAGLGSNDSKCSEITCAEFHTSCQDDLECVPNSYFCDTIDHCRNGFDEHDCKKCQPGSYPCGPGDDNICYKNTSRCDDRYDCPLSLSDELICCRSDAFGCYSLSDGSYLCLEPQLRCDGDRICQNYSLPEDCTTTMAPSTSETTEPMTSGPANLVTVVTVTTIFAVLAFVLMVIILYISIRCVARQKHRRQRFHFPPISKAGSSPPPRSDNSSIYSGMSSLGTESTNFNCGSPHPDPFVVKTAAFNPERSTHISNPPPSLITRRQSQLLEGEVESQADTCRAPPPSVDWENMSALSVSASQGGPRRTTMNGTGAEGYRYQRSLGTRRHQYQPHAGNPLHYNNVGFRGNNQYHHHGNGHLYEGGGSATTSVSSNARRSSGDAHYPGIPLSRLCGNVRGVPHYHSDLPNYEEAETETVFSQSTIHTENASNFPFDERVPPGRPPSPATITEYSERDIVHQAPPLSPKSEYSDEEEGEMENSLHIQEHQV